MSTDPRGGSGQGTEEADASQRAGASDRAAAPAPEGTYPMLPPRAPEDAAPRSGTDAHAASAADAHAAEASDGPGDAARARWDELRRSRTQAYRRERAYRAERSVALVRVLIFGVALMAFLAMQAAGTLPAGTDVGLTYAVFAAAGVYALGWGLLQPFRRAPALMTAHVAAATDSAFIAAVIWTTGAFASPFYLLWYISILGVAARYAFRETMGVAGVYAAVYVGLLAATGQVLPHAAELGFRVGMLVLIAASGGLLASEAAAQTRMKVRLDEERARLARALEDLQQIAHATSHDLQTPLRDVVRYGQLLERRLGDRVGEEGREYVRYVAEGAREMENLVRGLSAYAGLHTADEEMAPTDLDRLVDRALARLDGRVRAVGAEVTRDPLPTVVGDADDLLLMLEHLLHNALIFHPSLGGEPGSAPEASGPVRVHVGAETDDGTVLLWVRDNGIGIEERHHDRIFSLFHRLHTKEAYPGTGIGLALCRKVVERHGGRIWVESEPGKGSTFYVALPRRGPVHREGSGAAEAETGDRGTGGGAGDGRDDGRAGGGPGDGGADGGADRAPRARLSS